MNTINGQCTICGMPIEKDETNSCTIARNCLNITVAEENALKN